MAKLVLVADHTNTVQLYADATLIGDAAGIQDLYIERLHFESSGKTVSFSVDSGVATRLVLPAKLLKKDEMTGEYYLASRKDLITLSQDELSALRERVRQRLAQPFVLLLSDSTEHFFGVRACGAAAITASCFISPAILDGLEGIELDDWILKLTAVGQLNFTYALKDYKVPPELAGRLNLNIVVRRRKLADIASAVMAAFDVDIPEFSGFDLKLHAIALPNLSFDGLSFEVPKDWFPSLLDLAFPSFGQETQFAITAAPKFGIAVSDGQIRITTATPGAGEFQSRKADGTVEKMLGVADLTLLLENGRLDFTATIEPFTSSYARDDVTIDKSWLPFLLHVEKLAVTTEIAAIDLANAKSPAVKINYQFGGLKIVSRTEPDLFITLDLNFETSSSEGMLATRVTTLEVVAPYPVELIKKGSAYFANAVGELVRLVGPVALPRVGAPGTDPLKRLLAHLGRMLGSAIIWLARQAGAAAGMLAGLLESVAKALGSLIEILVKEGEQAFSHVIIEVRLDPKTYQLRQIILQPTGWKAVDGTLNLSALDFDLRVCASLEPSLVIDFGSDQWFGLVVQPKVGAEITLGTDLWLNRETGPGQPVSTVDTSQRAAKERLIQIRVKPGAYNPAGGAKAHELVVIAIQRGNLRLFQKIQSLVQRAAPTEIQLAIGANAPVISLSQSGSLVEATIGTDPSNDLIVEYSADVAKLKEQVLALMPKADTTSAPTSGGGVLDELKQKIEIIEVTHVFNGRNLEITFSIKIHLDTHFAPVTQLIVLVDLSNLAVKLTGGDRIAIRGKGKKSYSPFGVELQIRPQNVDLPDSKDYEQFYLDLAHGGESMGLGSEAVAELSYGSVSSSGKGLQFRVPMFRVGRGGIDLEAHIKPDPVTLGGVDVPFKFDAGHIAISGSRFSGGSLTGSGQLPQSLIGEANASIALTLAGRDNSIVVEAATARIDKSGDPIRCTATRFDLKVTELGFDFVREGGSYHFFFQVTGSASFNPGKGEFTNGLLKHFGGVEIKLDKAPVAADPRVLMRAMSFKVKVDPVKTIKAFDIFSFELRSFGYHPASPAFAGDPAISIGGQIKFMKSGDKNTVRMDFHDLWCSFGDGTPRFRCDGLTVGLALSGVKVEGTAISVDGGLPSLYKPDVLPANVTAHGFLASGKIEFPGWSPMTAAMGFLELRNKNDKNSAPRHAFFIYGQLEKQTEPIDTPVGRIYLREYGFGFGYRYTLAGIARAETAKSPNELIQILDEVSRFQGSLDRFEAWQPTYDNADLTFALRGMFSMAAASERGSYNADKEKDLPNPLLLDIVAALRTDLTFLINVRAWIAVNYHDWTTAAPGDVWRTNPTMRGYLYFSVPRKEFLGRFIANKVGHIGVHPQLPSQLVDAIRGTDFSATLYIRPGLFHFELGWPYELGIELGKPTDNFYMKINGGLIHRMEDYSVLFGMAFRAVGSVHLEGRVGSDSFGAAAVAHVDFAIEAKILSFMSLRSPAESMFYGELRIDVTIQVSVEVWLSFKVFGHRIHLSTGFALYLAVSIALEAVLSAKGGLGGRAHASVGIRAFGRSASIGIGFSFNNGLLAEARARVARYSAMGLSAPVPDRSQDGSRVENNPPPQSPRSEVAAIGDQVVDEIATAPPDTEAANDTEELYGRPIVQTEFWAMLFPTAPPAGVAGDWYVMQIVPRDHTLVDGHDHQSMNWSAAPASFYTSPRDTGSTVAHLVECLTNIEGLDAIIVSALWEDCGNTLDLASPKRWDEGHSVNLGGVVQKAGPGQGSKDVTIHTLLMGLFLELEKDDTQVRSYGEPRPRLVTSGLDELNTDREASARQLARSGRTRANLQALAKREAEIEESRSAVLAAVVDSAARLAQQGVAGGVWPKRHAEIDARDFGLTFLLNREAIDQLFPDLGEQVPRTGCFTVTKSDVAGAGSVLLFNPPERMFREAQPSFAPTHKIEPQGIKLDWDLEPSWGNSRGIYHDPEFHLKHYRIVRTIEGIGERRFRAEFMVKAAAPVTITEDTGNPDAICATYTRPPFQFVDDLRKQGSAWNERGEEDIPHAIRDVLLGQGSYEKWNNEVGADDLASVRINYQIVAVDIAGTCDFGRSYSVTGFKMAKRRPLSPREVTLQLMYSRLPEFPAQPQMPQLRLLVHPGIVTRDDVEEIQWPEENQVFQLRILSEPARATGAYGTDAIDATERRLDERAIDNLQGDDVADFLITIKMKLPDTDTGAGQLVSEYVPEGEDPGKHPSHRYRLEIHKISGSKMVLAGMEDIANLLGADLAQVGLTHRLFLRRLDFVRTPSSKLPSLALLDEKVHGEWRTVNANIVVADLEKTHISAMVEEFEQPVDVAFRALSRNDMVSGESGRLHIIQPGSGTDLSMLVRAEVDKDIDPFETVRDRTRRTASRLTWKARPEHLQLSPTAVKSPVSNLFRCIGGFDLHRIDIDGVPKGADLANFASPLGRVTLLPPSLAGLEQEGFGDFGNLESAYPSDTLRQLKAPSASGASGVRQAAWFSLAESTALFPRPAIRRSLMADPDEDMLAALFAGGTPTVIRVSIPAWDLKNADPLTAWDIRRAENPAGSLQAVHGDLTAGAPDNQGAVKAAYFAFDGPQPGRITVALVRDLLQSLCLVPKEEYFLEAYHQEDLVLQQRIDDPHYLAAVNVKVEALYLPSRKVSSQVLAVTAVQEVLVDLVPALHPVLTDTLALLAYAPLTENGAGSPGQVYRRYSLVPDAAPETTARTFGDWLDESPPERDPHGWGALRTLGLAYGFRLYDPEAGEYVKGQDLLTAVNDAMERALARYCDLDEDGLPRRYNGQAFADLLTRPWGNAKLFWFDGGYRNLNRAEGKDLIRKELLAVMQIALRPAPDRLGMTVGREDDGPHVYYFELLLCDDKVSAEISNWVVALKAPTSNEAPQMRFDVLASTESLVANHPQRLSDATPYQLRARPAKGERIAVVRATRIGQGSGTPRALAEAALELSQIEMRLIAGSDKAVEEATSRSFCLQELTLGVLNLKDGEVAVTDPAFGKFDALSGEDWADALFRPVGGEKTYTVAPVTAYKSLSFYAGRRFSRLTVRQGAVVQEDNANVESADARQERAEVAASLVRFWLRFIEHCAPATASESRIYFSLGTVADPGQWRCAPDREGNISVLIPDMSRRGARRKFAVRPVGRYESWVKAANNGLEREATLAGALQPDSTEQFFDLTLPRTEPLEKPVVLSAMRHLSENGEASGRLELVVAHGLDMVLGQANQRNDAQLALLDLSVGYWREFTHRDWLRALTALARDTGVTFDALAPFGSIAPQVPEHILPPLNTDKAASRLVELRERVPDAWLGATMVTAVPPPYFFRVHTLLHFSAGIVLSEQTGTTFEEGASTLSFAHAEGGYKARRKAAAPFYEVLREGDNEDLMLLLDLPAVRFIDCMPVDEAQMWFGEDGEHWKFIRSVVHVPEPGVSYRIAVETALETSLDGQHIYEPLARQTEVDLLPAPTPAPAATQAGAPPVTHQGLYLAHRSGSRLHLSPNGGKAEPLRIDPVPLPNSDALEWRIQLPLYVDAQALPRPLSAPLNTQWSDALETALAAMPVPALLARAIDGLRKVTLTKAAHVDDWSVVWNQVVALLRVNDAVERAPEALDTLLSWAVQPESGAVLRLALPIYLIDSVKLALSALCGAGAEIDWGVGIQSVVLRRAPTDGELALIGNESGELGEWLYGLAKQQLFGDGRRLVFSAMKGTLSPIMSDIGRKQLP